MTDSAPLPAVSYLKIPESGDPYLEGSACQACNAVFLDTREHCSKCGARNQMRTTKLANTGKLYSYSIVTRSFPGIEVPFISAIVDLDGGPAVKGNLIGIEADPDQIKFDMPVRLVYKDALGRKDSEGRSYLAYFFEPRDLP